MSSPPEMYVPYNACVTPINVAGEGETSCTTFFTEEGGTCEDMYTPYC